MLERFRQIMNRIEGQIIGWSAPQSDMPCPLVAVSGGADSMCLADLCLKTLGPDRFAVAHCNFHLRGEESDGDEALVAAWAESNGVRFFRTDFDTEGYACEKGGSIEMAARDLRYGWFAELCHEHGFAGVMTAHNANDNAETLILNLLRGSGLRGISGMSEVSEHHYGTDGDMTLRVIRPLLSFTRKQIEGHDFAWKVPYRNDSTNSISDYRRNRIRNDVFPHFEKINPSFVRTLNRETGYFAEADAIVGEWCGLKIKGILRHESASDVIDLPLLLSERHWRYLLYVMLEPYGFHSSVLASIEDLLGSVRTASGKRFESGTHVLKVERNELVIVRKKEADVPVLRPMVSSMQLVASDDCIMTVRGPGIYGFNGIRFEVELLQWSPDMRLKQPEGTLIFDASRLSFPFVCRRWNKGDWFVPFGMKGRKKISDLFTDLKYGSADKESAVILVDCRGDLAENRHVAAVLGVRIDEMYKVGHTTDTIMKITLKR